MGNKSNNRSWNSLNHLLGSSNICNSTFPNEGLVGKFFILAPFKGFYAISYGS